MQYPKHPIWFDSLEEALAASARINEALWARISGRGLYKVYPGGRAVRYLSDPDARKRYNADDYSYGDA